MTVGLTQRVLAGYRVPLFDLLAETLPGGLALYAGSPRADEMIDSSRAPEKAVLHRADNLHLFSGKFYLCIQRDLMDWLKKTDPEALIMEANMRYPMSAFAARWMRSRRRPVIGWGLGTGSTGGSLLRSHLAGFDALLTYSSAGKQSYINAGFPAERIFTACNAAAPRPKRPMPNRPADCFLCSPVVLYVGRLQARKRLDLLIRACAEQESRPALWIVGDGPERAALEAFAKETYPETEFFGAKYGAELTAIFDHADLFVLPGTGGLALQQAMASALPLIAAEADGTQADLVRPQNGIQVAPGSQESLTAAMRELLADPVRLRQMGAESFRIVSEEINLEAMAAVFAKVVESVKENGARK